MAQDQYHIPSLVRALSLLETLAETRDGFGVSELAERLDIPKNSAFRITATLADHGYLLRDPVSKRFTLSHRFLSLGYAATGAQDLQDKALDRMRQLRDDTGETVLLGTLVGQEGIVLEQIPSQHPVKFLVDVGTRYPLHTAAPGKAMLAYLPLPEQERLLAMLPFTIYNARTLSGPAALRAELETVRRQGYAVDHAEQLDGVHCVSAPIFDHRGYPIAAVWVTAPSLRLRHADFPALARQVMPQAAVISQRLGHAPGRGTAADRPRAAAGA